MVEPLSLSIRVFTVLRWRNAVENENMGYTVYQ